MFKKEQSKAKGQNFEVIYNFKNTNGTVENGKQTILAKDETEAIDDVEAYLLSNGIKKENISIDKVSLIPDEDQKKCFEVTYTWTDDKKNASKLQEKVYAKDAGDAKEMVIKYTQKRHKFMVEVAIIKVDEITKDGEMVEIENHEANPKSIAMEPSKDPVDKKRVAIPDYVRQSTFQATVVGESTVPKNNMRVMTLKLQIVGEQVEKVSGELMKFKPGEAMMIEVTPLQLHMVDDIPKKEDQMTIYDTAIQNHQKGDEDAKHDEATKNQEAETKTHVRDSEKTAPKKKKSKTKTEDMESVKDDKEQA